MRTILATAFAATTIADLAAASHHIVIGSVNNVEPTPAQHSRYTVSSVNILETMLSTATDNIDVSVLNLDRADRGSTLRSGQTALVLLAESGTTSLTSITVASPVTYRPVSGSNAIFDVNLPKSPAAARSAEPSPSSITD